MATQFELPVALERKQDDPFLALIDKAMDKNPEVVGQMLDHYERWQKMQAKKDFDEAMLALKANIPPIIKRKLAKIESSKGAYSYHYADIEEVCDKIDPVLVAHKFDKRWTAEPSDKGIVISCILKHGGHSETTTLPPAPHDNSGGKNALQAIGSSLSYLQRYSLLMALGIAPRNVDTDGKAPQERQGGKMDEGELKERLAHFDKCASYQEVNAHYSSSFKVARTAKDKDAEDAFIAAKSQAYVRLRSKQ